MKTEIQQFLNEGKIKEAAAYIKEALKNGANLENMNVNLAHILLLAGEWSEITALLPKGTNFFHTSGWLNSLGCNRPINEENKPIPWFTYPAIEFLDDIVDKNWKVFEWGSGNSTLWWASKVKKIIAIEDNQEWFMEVKNQLPQNSEIFYRTHNEYFDSILMYPDCSFDAIVIDGSYRNEASKNSVRKIKDQGIIIFDNSDAMEHEFAQRYLISQGLYRIDFWGMIPSYLYKNCTSIYFKDPDIFKQINTPTTHRSSVGKSCQQSIDKMVGKSRTFEDDVKVCAVKNLKDWAKDNEFERIKVMLEGSFLPPEYLLESVTPLWKDCIKTYFANLRTDYHVVYAKNVIVSSYGWLLNHGNTIDEQYDIFSSSYDILIDDKFWLPYIVGKGIFREHNPDFSKMVIDFTGSRIVEIRDKCIFIGSRRNFGHWMIDFLSKFAAFEKLPKNDEYKLIFGPLTQNQKISLELLGIPSSQIIELEVLCGEVIRYLFDDLIFIPSVPTPVGFKYLRNRFAETVSDTKRRSELIYISRRQEAPRHKISNIDEVEEFFKNKGFLIINDMGKIPFRDQISLLSNVKIMVITLGADVCNIAMCRKDTVIILLTSEAYASMENPEIVSRSVIPYLFTAGLPIIPVFGKPVNPEDTSIDGLATYDLQTLNLSIERAFEYREKIIKPVEIKYNSFDIGEIALNNMSLRKENRSDGKNSERLVLCRISPMPKYPDTKTTAFFLSHREAYRPIMFSTNEVYCGPDCETKTIDGTIKTIKTKANVFDISQVIEELPPKQKPELIVVKTDATGRNFPINLKQYSCPKLLILGDTHHLNKPIQTLLVYAAQEKFDYIISDHDRHHLHFFKEAGFNNVSWIPCINIYPHEQPVFEDKTYDVSFVGQVGRWHPNRKTVLNFLQANDIPVQIMQAPHEKAAEIYANSLINLNISLNGDLNLRVFEVLSSGGFLLTDRLSRESGLDMIFTDGEHLVCYDSPQDLLEKIRYYLKNPGEAKAIAKKGYEEYLRRHTPEIKANELMNYIFNGRLHPLYDISQDKRSIHVKSPSQDSLFVRIALYEFVQNLHLNQPEVTLLFTPSINPRILCDLSDLPRLRLYIRENGSEIPSENLKLLNAAHVADQIHPVTWDQIRNTKGAWDAVVMTSSDMMSTDMEDFLNTVNFRLLILSDGLSSPETGHNHDLIEFLKITGFEKINDNPVVFHWKNKSMFGEYLFSKELTAGAVRSFERALLDNPADEDALNNLGVISHQLKRYPAAENFLIKAVSLNRRNTNALDNLIQNHIATEKFEDAAGLLQERIGMEPDHPDLYSLLGLCHQQMGHTQEAFDAYLKAEKFGGPEYSILEHIRKSHAGSTGTDNRKMPEFISRKILVINNLYPPQELGGYGRLLYDFTNLLRKRGHSIYVLTSDTSYLGNTDGDAPDVDRSLLLFGGWEGGVCKSIENREDVIKIVKQNLDKLNHVLNNFRPEVCLLGNIDFLSRNIIDPMLERKIPVIHHLGNQAPGYSVPETPKSRLYHLAAASNWLKNVVQKNGYPFKQTSVVYPGAMVEEFRMRIPTSLDRLRIAYASIVLPYKGPHILINALKKLHDQGIDFACSIAGTSTNMDFVNQLKSFVTQSGMDEKIRFLGNLNREELKQLFARHNTLVFPSIVKEAFGISQVEAMAAGLAVVTSATGGAKEIVEHGVSGIIFKSEDDASLAEALIQLTRDTQRWRQIALAGQRRAIEKFDIERSVDALEACFSQLLKVKRTQR